MRKKIAVGLCEGLRPVVRPRHGLEDGITDISQRKRGVGACNRLVWIRTDTSGGFL